MPFVINPAGRVVSVLEDSDAYRNAVATRGGWQLVEASIPDSGAGSSEPAPVAGPVKRKRGRPRKDANRRSR